jgi:hypothetical protein
MYPCLVRHALLGLRMPADDPTFYKTPSPFVLKTRYDCQSTKETSNKSMFRLFLVLSKVREIFWEQDISRLLLPSEVTAFQAITFFWRGIDDWSASRFRDNQFLMADNNVRIETHQTGAEQLGCMERNGISLLKCRCIYRVCRGQELTSMRSEA